MCSVDGQFIRQNTVKRKRIHENTKVLKQERSNTTKVNFKAGYEN